MSDDTSTVTAFGELEDFFENAAVGLHIVGADGTILRANRAEFDLLGYAREDYIGRHIGDFHADQPVLEQILTRLAAGEKLDRYPARLRAKDGSIKHVVITSNALFRDGKFVSTRCLTVDETELRRAETRTRGWYRHLLDSLPAAVYTTDAAGRITYYNPAAVELSGRRPQIGRDEWCVTARLYTPDGAPLPHDQCPMAVALKEQRPLRGAEAVAERPDGTRVPFMAFPTPLHDEETGAIIGAVNMLVDISERKRAEATQARLVKELNHRINNALANVQALARLTMSRSRSPAEFTANLLDRVQALARAHTLLSDATWQGIDLETLLRDQMVSKHDEGLLSAAGPLVTFEPQLALHMSMVLHELAANARKHGAFSVPNGRVGIHWGITDGVLQLEWVERGAPPASASTAPGFGTMLVERTMKAHGGAAQMTRKAEGIAWQISLPLPPRIAHETLDSNAAGPLPAATVGRRFGPMSGKYVLVVEDEPLVALDISATLEAAGVVVVGPVGNRDDALRLIGSTVELDAALLDANLHRQSIDEIAAVLTQHRVPFAIVAGGSREVLPLSFREARLIEKPFTREELLATLEHLLLADTGTAVPLRGRAP